MKIDWNVVGFFGGIVGILVFAWFVKRRSRSGHIELVPYVEEDIQVGVNDAPPMVDDEGLVDDDDIVMLNDAQPVAASGNVPGTDIIGY